MALERPETPQSSGLRKTFDQIRPDTMESQFNGESPRSEEGNDAKVEIGKFKSLFTVPLRKGLFILILILFRRLNIFLLAF